MNYLKRNNYIAIIGNSVVLWSAVVILYILFVSFNNPDSSVVLYTNRFGERIFEILLMVIGIIAFLYTWYKGLK